MTGRKKTYPDRIVLPLEEGIVARLDNARRNGEARVDVIRDAIERDLFRRETGGTDPIPPVHLVWEHPTPNLYRAHAPLIGWIRVESFGDPNAWIVSFSMPGRSETLINDEWSDPDEAKRAARDHIGDKMREFFRLDAESDAQ